MPRTKRVPLDGLTKFQRYRRAQARKGMKLLRVWVPHPKRPEFADDWLKAEGLRAGQTVLVHGTRLWMFLPASQGAPQPVTQGCRFANPCRGSYNGAV